MKHLFKENGKCKTLNKNFALHNPSKSRVDPILYSQDEKLLKKTIKKWE